MPSASYSFLDVAALDGVRERFAAGDALAILSNDLLEVIWANGPGAAMLGYADIEECLGASSRLGPATRRQIAGTRGFPAIGRDRPLQVRLTTGFSSRAAGLLASSLQLPDGEAAILLAEPLPAGGARSARDIAERAIGGFSEAGHFVAFLDADGKVEAASAGFADLALEQDTLASFVRLTDRSRIAKQMIPSRRGALPAGLARLTDDRSLLVVVDEGAAQSDDTAEAVATIPAPAEPGALQAATDDAGIAPPAGEETRAEGGHDSWYFSREEPAGKEPVEDAPVAAAEAVPPRPEAVAAPEPEDASPEAESQAAEPPQDLRTATGAAEESSARTPSAPAEPSEGAAVAGESAKDGDEIPAVAEPAARAPASPARRPAGPVRFVWRTDADGRFSQISPEFASAVGDQAADVVGRSFEEVARDWSLDPTGEIAGLLARRDTWSGRTVMWPVACTDLRVPVDLAALPVYDRNRSFEGFRGFGVARTGEATVDPRAAGLKLVEPAEDVADAGTQAEAPVAGEAGAELAESPGETTAPEDPFRGEVPVLSLVPAHDRRLGDKIIRLAEHRPAADNDKGLSTGERLAFQQIGERLKRDAGAKTPPREEKTPETGAVPSPGDEAAKETPLPADAPKLPEPPDVAAIDAETPPLDGAMGAGESTPPGGDVGAVTEDKADTPTASPVNEEALRDVAAGEPCQGPEGDKSPEEKAKPARPGLSLLDFAQWEDAGVETDEPPAVTEISSPDTGGEDPGESSSDAATEATGGTEPEEEAGRQPVERRGGWRNLRLVEMETPAALDVHTPLADGEPSPAGNRTAASEDGRPAADGRSSHNTESVPEQPGDEGAERRDAEPAGKPAAGLSILEKLPVPVLVHSGDTLHYANAEFAELTGYRSVAELAEAGGIGALFADSYDEEDAPEKVDRQLRLKTRDGSEIPVEAFLQSVPWDGGKALLLVLSRSSEGGSHGGQSPLIAELEARVAEMRTIIDTATDGVVLISPDGTIRSISRPAEALFGFESDDVVGKHFASLFAIESQRAARDYLAGLSENGVASVLNDGREVIGREAEGRFIPLFMTIGRLPNDSGYCAVVRDITQWKRAEEDLTQARALAERASSQKTDFLARVSHEIRTPLNAIIGFSELMMDEKFGPVANDRYRDYLRDINRSGNHVLDLVNDLLDISKIEAGQQEMVYEAVSLNDTLAETVAMMQPQANRERVIIRSSFASNLPDVVADLRSVRQIALNILSNAVRYTQAGGQVIISTAYETAGDVVMRVRDTGIGMSSAELEQALKPFKQINSLRRARGDGTGLGLPLTKAMVEANRAKFTINSTPGEGTLVEISFPPTRVLAD